MTKFTALIAHSAKNPDGTLCVRERQTFGTKLAAQTWLDARLEEIAAEEFGYEWDGIALEVAA